MPNLDNLTKAIAKIRRNIKRKMKKILIIFIYQKEILKIIPNMRSDIKFMFKKNLLLIILQYSID